MHVYYLDPQIPCSSGELFTQLTAQQQQVVLSQLIARIAHLARQGGHAIPPYAKPLRGIPHIAEIRSTYSPTELIRIYYFRDASQNKLYLLNYLIKPDGIKNPGKYSGKSRKVVTTQIHTSIHLAQTYYHRYFTHTAYYAYLSLD